MKKFKIGGVPEHFNYPWRVAIEEKAFDPLNVSLHWSDMTGGTGQMIKGLETGSLDIAVLLTEGISKAILQGTKAKILDVYVSSPLQWGIHVPIPNFPLWFRITSDVIRSCTTRTLDERRFAF